MIQFQKSDIKKHQLKPTVRFNLKMKMILLIGILILAIITFIGIFLHHFLSDTLEAEMGDQALNVAETVSHIPELVAAFEADDPASIIQPTIAPIQDATEAEFIVVGNTEEVRYAHPDEEEIGKKMVGGDNERALLNGESYTSKATGTLGDSLRAKVPIFLDGEIVGVVSVGFLVNDVQSLIADYSKEIWIVLFLIGGVGILGAILVTTYIKRVLFGMEPEEIAHVLFQKETILQSTHEGIIAVNQDGFVTMMNATAQQLLFNQEINQTNYIGTPVQNILPSSKLQEVLTTGNSQYDKESIFGQNVFLTNTVPIYYESELIGAVSTFRNKTEIESLTKELTHVRQYANALRAQTHEFSNKLYTILGLLYLDKKEEVVDLIQTESKNQQEWIRVLIDKVSDPLLSGLLLGKLNQAEELQVNLFIDPDSHLERSLSNEKARALLTAVGNLIDNAMDAIKENPPSNRNVSLFFTDAGNDIIFEIEDSGTGICEADSFKIFEKGFSMKDGSDRGIGLSITKQIISSIDGSFYLEEAGDLGGAYFVIAIPKDE
ncbi:two-component system CitB family sensor kinase/CitB family two-component system sensor histidine kinase CitS [Virgibacillus natechei]|uniref:histidine kinase n=1 Tax=Virgibacillus natechei TaxID=1216297 RepID=A0ABS4IL20_9BACI|nr:sensor histidine kinase [Virgibacillus natechei]MBP1971111.1 two-component system CitB family sensor kinase/CitB family two-component system sensor histidine kinase CitS [Virgibacillus natechei]UZD12203.1 sensor histidine kinase [Virgibacillus natechei]